MDTQGRPINIKIQDGRKRVKRKIFSILFALALVLSLGVVLVPASPVEAATPIYVDASRPDDTGDGTSWATAKKYIQSGVNIVDTGGTVNVAAGTYVEAVKIDKSLTLRGESGATIRPDNTTPTYDGSRRPAIYFNTVDNITIEGFIIDGTGGDVHSGICGVFSKNLTVRNNTIHDIKNTIGAPASDAGGVGITLWSCGSDKKITGCLIEGNTVYNTGRLGIFIGTMDSTYTKWLLSEDNVIRNNTVHHAYQGPTNDTMCGGICMDGAKNCIIEENTTYSNGTGTILMPGIYMNGLAGSNLITGNDTYDNNIGILVWTTRTNIDFEGQTPAPPKVQFNNIYENTSYGLYVKDAEPAYEVNATNNWWGDASGPTHAGNPGGTGDAVSDNVDYEPWTGAPVEETVTETVTDGTVDATTEADTEVVVDGTATVTVAQYSSNPGSGFGGDTGKYIDVHIDDVTNVTQIEIRLYYTNADIAGLDETSLALRWWDSATSSWVGCSDSGVNTTDVPPYSGYIWAKIRPVGDPNPTVPTLDDLTGAVFGGGGRTAPTGGLGGRAAITRPTLTGLTAEPPLKVNADGVVQTTCQLVTTDGKLTLDITEDTELLDSEGDPLESLSAQLVLVPPTPPPAGAILLAYDLGPDGARFNPDITLTVEYDPDEIPEGVAEEDLVIAYYDEEAGEWVELDSEVDTENNTITASVEHFTTFAIIAVTPPPVPAPAVFTSSSLSISPLEVYIGETVGISILVANTGEEEGSYTITLKINGVVEETREITLAGGASETVTFTTAKDEAGTYSVDVDGLTGSFTVREVAVPPPVVPPPAPPPGINWTIWRPVIIGVAVFLAIFLPIRLRRRRLG